MGEPHFPKSNMALELQENYISQTKSGASAQKYFITCDTCIPQRW